MNNLSDQKNIGGSVNPPPQPPPTQVSGNVGGISGKEKEIIGSPTSEGTLQDLGKEMELPKEVSAVGVKTKPTVVSMPQAVQQMGVKPVGATVQPQTPPPTLPLTDDQIAQGLQQSILSSWRWLAEWCKRRLQQWGIKK